MQILVVRTGEENKHLAPGLILGKLGRTRKLTWTMPLSANLTLRNFGLSTYPGIFSHPLSPEEALANIDALLRLPERGSFRKGRISSGFFGR